MRVVSMCVDGARGRCDFTCVVRVVIRHISVADVSDVTAAAIERDIFANAQR